MFDYIDAKKSIITKPNWIEEEDQLLNWAENFYQNQKNQRQYKMHFKVIQIT